MYICSESWEFVLSLKAFLQRKEMSNILCFTFSGRGILKNTYFVFVEVEFLKMHMHIPHSEDFVDIVLFFKGRARPYSINV